MEYKELMELLVPPLAYLQYCAPLHWRGLAQTEVGIAVAGAVITLTQVAEYHQSTVFDYV
jgi:hypothetical protein